MILTPALAAMLVSSPIAPKSTDPIIARPALIKPENIDLSRHMLLGMPFTMGLLNRSSLPIAFVGGTSVGVVGTSAPSSYTIPTTGLTGGIDTQARIGDLLIIATGFNDTSDGNPGVTDTTLVWNEVADLHAVTSYEGTNLSVNWARATVAPPATIGIRNVSLRSGATILSVYRNVSSTSPMDVTRTTATGVSSNQTNPPAITPATDGAAIVAIGFTAQGDNNYDITATSSGYGYSIIRNSRSSIWDISGGLCSLLNVKGGVSQDPGVFTITNKTNASWAAATLALRPA